jgi:anti-sigma regulatory factor (Ser/Thr protein kinase)
VNARKLFEAYPGIDVQSASPGWTHLHILPAQELREKITGFVRSELADLPGDLCEQLSLAADELLGNSMEHGCALDPFCKIDFSLIRTPRMIIFQIGDTGPGFSPDSIAHAAVSNPPEEPLLHASFRTQMGLRPGGFGILLVRQIADELIYNETANEVMLIKYLDPIR